jgi:hypothetical protein
VARNKHGSPARRDKRYTPKAKNKHGGLAVIDAIAGEGEARYIIEQVNQPLRPVDVGVVETKYWIALADVRTGAGTEKSWSYLCTCLNLTLGLCELGFGKEHLPQILQAFEGAQRAMVRGKQSGTYRFDGPGLTALTDVLQVHEAQLEFTTTKDLLAAEKIVAARVKQGHTYDQHPEPASRA